MITTAPLATSDRVHLLDALRGFAILGMWIVHTTIGTGWTYQVELMPMEPRDFATATLAYFFLNGKFFTIFSFLFGIGVYVQIERTRKRGDAATAFMLRRSIGLLIIALLAIAVTLRLWILVDYAIVGMASLVMIDRKPKTILRSAVASIIFAILINEVASPYRDIVELREVAAARGVSVETVVEMQADEVIEHRLVLDAEVRTRNFVQSAQVSIVRWFEAQALWSTWVDRVGTFGMLLIGIYIARRGAVWNRDVRCDIARDALPSLLGIGTACSLYAMISIDFDVGDHYSPLQGILEAVCRGWFGNTLMGLGYVAAFTLLFDRTGWRKVLSAFTPVGRMALTCYIMTFFLWEFVSLGWGLGKFGLIGPALGALFVFVAFPAMTIAACLWLNYFRFGPAEWLWRSMTYGIAQPLRLQNRA